MRRQSGELYPRALGDKPEVVSDGVERARLRDREFALGVAAKDAQGELTLGGLIRQLDRVDPVRLDGDDGNVLPGNHARETQTGLEILKFRHRRLRGRPYRVRPDGFKCPRTGPYGSRRHASDRTRRSVSRSWRERAVRLGFVAAAAITLAVWIGRDVSLRVGTFSCASGVTDTPNSKQQAWRERWGIRQVRCFTDASVCASGAACRRPQMQSSRRRYSRRADSELSRDGGPARASQCEGRRSVACSMIQGPGADGSLGPLTCGY